VETIAHAIDLEVTALRELDAYPGAGTENKAEIRITFETCGVGDRPLVAFLAKIA